MNGKGDQEVMLGSVETLVGTELWLANRENLLGPGGPL